MAEINWIPKFIRQFLERRPLHRVTHEEYNELFNLLINQGDHNSQGITDLYAIFGHVQGGIADPNNLESIDFYANGFSATYDGNTVSYTWTKDIDGKITSLITEDNVVIPVTWNEGDM